MRAKKKNIYKPAKSTLLHFKNVEEAIEEFKEEFTKAVKDILMSGAVFSVHPYSNKFNCKVGDEEINEYAGFILASTIEDVIESESPSVQNDIKNRICQLLVAYNSDCSYAEWDSWMSEWCSALWEFYNSDYWPSDLYKNVKYKIYERLAEDLIKKGTVKDNIPFSKEFFTNRDWLSYTTFKKSKQIIDIWRSTITDELLIEVDNEN